MPSVIAPDIPSTSQVLIILSLSVLLRIKASLALFFSNAQQ